MSWAWRVARALLGSQYALMLEYRAEIALWALSGVLPLIMLGVWSGSGAAAAAGLSPQQLSHYFLAAFVVRQFTVVWLIQVFEDDALQGRLSPFLLQPLSPLWRYLAAHFSEQASRIPFVAVMVLVVGLVFIVAGISFKLSAAPFHMWAPDVYQGAPTAVVLFIGSAPKLAAFGFVMRLLVEGMGAMVADWQGMLMILAVMSMMIGNLAAIAQTNIKRMLA